MDELKPYFTVFTPTYNRSDTLERVYKSLINQTMKDFEWLIVDDGSTDNTKSLVDSFINEEKINIRYIWQCNGHKKVAFNRGVKEAYGFMFIPADSDDEFDFDTLEIFKKTFDKQSDKVKKEISGVVCLCKDENSNIIGDRYPSDEWLSDNLEMRYAYSVSGEKWGCMKTEILREYPFPENVEGHVPESVIWIPIASKYKTIYINRPLRTYFTNELDSISNTGFLRRDLHGAYLLSKTILEYELKFFINKPFFFLKAAANYTRFKLGMNKNLKNKNELHLNKNRFIGGILIVLLSPLGFVLYLRDIAR